MLTLGDSEPWHGDQSPTPGGYLVVLEVRLEDIIFDFRTWSSLG